MCSYLSSVKEVMKAYYVKNDGNGVILVNVLYEACYEKYGNDYV